MCRRSLKIGISLIALAITIASCSGASEHRPTPANGSSSSGSLRVGQIAPDFTLRSASGGSVRLSSFKDYRPVLLYFSMGPG
jgi:cytochrome oxidase Cu insertion factor (SCO1/SenC/PrrC family)